MDVLDPGSRIRFSGLALDAERGVLEAADGTETTLRPKTLDLALLLLRNPGRVVSRAEILDRVWPGVFVTDDSVTQCVVELRRALGDRAGLLKTIPKRGYVLEAEVLKAVEALPPRPALTEEDLPAPSSMALTARRRHWPAGVAALGLAVAVWLLWPGTPPPAPPPPIVPALAPPPTSTEAAQPNTPDSTTPEAESMRLWREGRAALRRPGILRERRLESRALFERAIELDPRNFRALAEAAFTYTNAVQAGDSLNPEADLRTAERLAERAIAVNPDHAVTHTARAALLRLRRDFEAALVHYRRAVELDPTAHASRANIGFMQMLLGRPEGALEPVLASLAAQPDDGLRGTWNAYAGLIQLHAQAEDFGVARLRASLPFDGFMTVDERMLYLAAALHRSGDAAGAAALVRDIAQRRPNMTLGWFAARPQGDHPIYRAQFSEIVSALRAAGLPE